MYDSKMYVNELFKSLPGRYDKHLRYKIAEEMHEAMCDVLGLCNEEEYLKAKNKPHLHFEKDLEMDRDDISTLYNMLEEVMGFTLPKNGLKDMNTPLEMMISICKIKSKKSNGSYFIKQGNRKFYIPLILNSFL